MVNRRRATVYAAAGWLACSLSLAHPGGVDADGCHVESRTQQRHCHAPKSIDTAKVPRPGDEGVLFGPLLSVKDGDSFVARIQGYSMEFRLAGIDAPEFDQPFAQQSRETLMRLIGDEQCVLVPMDTDRYGRTVAHLWVGDTYVNGEMVRAGAAWFYPQFAQDDALYRLENEARDAKRGLWGLPGEPVEPWEWRRRARARQSE